MRNLLLNLSSSRSRNRLIAVVKYRWQLIYIRQILTHFQYGKEK